MDTPWIIFRQPVRDNTRFFASFYILSISFSVFFFTSIKIGVPISLPVYITTKYIITQLSWRFVNNINVKNLCPLYYIMWLMYVLNYLSILLILLFMKKNFQLKSDLYKWQFKELTVRDTYCCRSPDTLEIHFNLCIFSILILQKLSAHVDTETFVETLQFETPINLNPSLSPTIHKIGITKLVFDDEWKKILSSFPRFSFFRQTFCARNF